MSLKFSKSTIADIWKHLDNPSITKQKCTIYDSQFPLLDEARSLFGSYIHGPWLELCMVYSYRRMLSRNVWVAVSECEAWDGRTCTKSFITCRACAERRITVSKHIYHLALSAWSLTVRCERRAFFRPYLYCRWNKFVVQPPLLLLVSCGEKKAKNFKKANDGMCNCLRLCRLPLVLIHAAKQISLFLST